MSENKNGQKDHKKEEKNTPGRETPTFGKAPSSEVKRCDEDKKKEKSHSGVKR